MSGVTEAEQTRRRVRQNQLSVNGLAHTPSLVLLATVPSTEHTTQSRSDSENQLGCFCHCKPGARVCSAAHSLPRLKKHLWLLRTAASLALFLNSKSYKRIALHINNMDILFCVFPYSPFAAVGFTSLVWPIYFNVVTTAGHPLINTLQLH